jgi:hypothetical protein
MPLHHTAVATSADDIGIALCGEVAEHCWLCWLYRHCWLKDVLADLSHFTPLSNKCRCC